MSHLHRAGANCSEGLKGHHILRVQLPINLHLYTKVLVSHHTEKKKHNFFLISWNRTLPLLSLSPLPPSFSSSLSLPPYLPSLSLNSHNQFLKYKFHKIVSREVLFTCYNFDKWKCENILHLQPIVSI